MSVINSIPLIAAGDDGYQISRSVRLRSSASAYFNRTPASAGNRQKFTFSGWIKRGTVGTGADLGLLSSFVDNSNRADIRFGINSNASVQFSNQTGGSQTFSIYTNAIYRDPSAWYHIVVSVDTTQATSSNRVLIYVNGASQSLSGSYPSLNENITFNYGISHYLGLIGFSPLTGYFDGYLTEINFIDGQALTPAAFGETDTITGVWKPKKYAGTYGTNGFYLNFSDNSAATAAAIGKDSSGNGNNWTPNNISVTAGVTYDSMIDVPTMYADGGNGRGNYAVASTIDKAANISVSDANLNTTETGGVSYGLSRSTIGISTGKWYFEGTVKGVTNSTGALGRANIGVQTALGGLTNYVGADSNGWGYNFDGLKLNNGSTVAYGAGYVTGDVIGVALDMDAGTLTFYKNGTTQGQAFSGITGVVFPAFCSQSVSNTSGWYANFGQRPFTYTPPTGFLALNTQNLPDSTIKAGNKFFDVSTWTGNGASPRTISGLSFQPDLVWIKGRSIATSHLVNDAVRGANLGLFTNLTNAEAANNAGGYLSAFTSSGFSVTAGSVDFNIANTNGESYVGWQWKESPSAGFDIVTFTGTGGTQNISHSLGVAPKMMIFKSRNNASGWSAYHASIGNTGALNLQTTAATSTTIDWWNNTSPTSSQFTIGANINISGWTWVGYLFSEVAGFSKFGSYTGNGSADGPMVFTGFLPKWVMIKRTDSTADWQMYDTARGTVNVINATLAANLSSAESAFTSGYDIDFLSNGFKPRSGPSNAINTSGGTYIYAAFASNPFKYSLAR